MGRPKQIFWIGALITGLVACGTLLKPEEWNAKDNGPVIPHDSFPSDCSLCHVGGSWTEIRDDFEFDHFKETGVPLFGAHEEAACLRCHNDRGPVEQFADRGCAGCHEDVHRARLGPRCENCHDETTWHPNEAIAMHASTRFPLVGPHASAECFSCHEGAQVGNFEGLEPVCAICHMSDAAAVVDPDHIANGWVTDCQRCHAEVDWKPAQFDHPASFALTRGHGGLDCAECHLPGTFEGLSTDCASCHTPEYNATTDPNHAAAGFSTDCMLCHDTGDWDNADFEHPMSFQLVGGHDISDCSQCHINGNFTTTPTDCAACHTDDYNATTDPDHAASGFSTDCMQCHDVFGWGGADFTHTATFPLTNGHDLADCTLCHDGGIFVGTPTDCASCHTDDYNATTDPNHIAAGFSTDCMMCHDTVSWGTGNFEHPMSFQLIGGHDLTDCTLCHDGGVFVGTPTDCVACHLPDYNATTDPNHIASGFDTDCMQCHDVFGWGGADFAHTATFPLTAGHDLADCTLCHDNGIFVGTPTDCSACHTDDYNATTNPNHMAAGFPLDCMICHDTSAWLGANFVHTPTFPLTLGHNLPDCNDCHSSGVFVGLPSDCASCHTDDYNATTNPNHMAAGFPLDCMICHDTSAWLGANFVHTPGFPLIGGHNLPDCNDCHSSGVFVGLPSDCASCHTDDYNATTNPDHADSGFPLDCMQCHDVFDWGNGVFNHSFPINNGDHSNLDCIDCHTVPSATPAFSCIDCHEHRQSEMDDDHSEVPGYVWASSACFMCHPDGRD